MESTQDFLLLITPGSPAISARSGGLHGTAGFGVAGFGQLVAAILPSATGPGLIDQIRALKDLKSAAAAAQARLSAADRSAVDAELAPEASTFNGLGDRAVTAAARTAAYRRDARSVALRASHAATERRVSLRRAPDTKTYLTALLPAAEGEAVYATLTRQTRHCG